MQLGRNIRHLTINWTKLQIVLVLAFIIGIGFFLRTYYALPVAVQNGFAVSGGSDSYYHERVITYILATKHQLLYDTMLNYPVGLIDPRPPFFEWAVVALGYVFTPFLGWNVHLGVEYAFMLITAIFGALSAIPMYLIGKATFNRRVGIISAFLIATSAANLTRSIAAWGGYDDVILFFALFTWYFFLKALKTVNGREWIENWGSLTSIKTGAKRFFSENYTTLVYAALSGTSLATVAVMWTGFSYIITIILIYLILQVFINRFRNRSSFHILIISGIFGVFAFVPSLPWYWIEHVTGVWYNIPLYLLLFSIIVIFFIEITSRYPWTFVFPTAVGIMALIYIIGWAFEPTLMKFIVTGQGYFIKNKVYATIAEAQSPTLAQIIMNVSVGIFFLYVAGFLYMIYLARKKLYDYHIFFIVFSAVSTYMAFSAARFIINASPGFIIPAAFMLELLISRLNLSKIYTDFKALSHLGFGGFKKSVKWTKVLAVIMITIFIIVPNVWSAMDSAIPYNTKQQYDKQIYDALPAVMRPSNYTSTWYLGAFGYYLPPTTDPWARAEAWLAQQDTNLSMQDRPAFLSWWDYGFQTIQQGKHPVVADNFQDGYQVAGQVLTTQNESKVIALLISRVLDGDHMHAVKEHLGTVFTPAVKTALIKYLGVKEESKIEVYYSLNTKTKALNTQYIHLIHTHTQIYGQYTKNITASDLKYILVKGDLSYHYPETVLVNLYQKLQQITGYSIEYIGVDYRLFPFSGTQTGVFYAPAYLSDRKAEVINGNIIPYTYYTLYAVGSTGKEYPLNKVPANVHVVSYTIKYTSAFYNTTLYRIFVGYSGKDIGRAGGIPGISSSMRNYPTMQAWNMTHFELVYKTAFWNPYKNYQNHTKAWKPIPIQKAYYYEQKHIGTVELNLPAAKILPHDVVIVKYYPGAIIKGRVTLPDGLPLKHVMVTLYDQYNIPHTYTYTNAEGYYTVYAVAGNDTLKFSTGGSMNKLFLVDKTILDSVNIYISNAQAERIPTFINSSGVPDYIITKNIIIPASNVDGLVYLNINNTAYYSPGDKLLPHAVVSYYNATYGAYYNVTTNAHGYYSISNVIPHTYQISVTINNVTYKYPKTETVNLGKNQTIDLKFNPDRLYGTVIHTNAPARTFPIVIKRADGYTTTVYSDAHGHYSSVLFPGNYIVYVNESIYRSSIYTVKLPKWNMSKSQNISVYKVFRVSGQLQGIPTIPAHAFLKFADPIYFQNTTITYTDAHGKYNVYLCAGFYEIYSEYLYNNVKYAYIGSITVVQNTTFNITLLPAYALSGYVVYKNHSFSQASVTLFHNSNFVTVFTNNTGYYYISVPRGKYNIGVVAYNATSAAYSNYTTIDHTETQMLNISLLPAKAHQGTLYITSHFQHFGSQILDNGLIIMSNVYGPIYETYVAPNHHFLIYPQTNFTVRAIVPFYHVSSVTYMGRSVSIYMTEDNVTVTGQIIYINNNYSKQAYIMFKDLKGTYSTQIVNDHYSISLAPGSYHVSFVGAGVELGSKTKTIMIYGQNATTTLNFHVAVFANVSVTPTLAYSFWFNTVGKLSGVGAATHLLIGNYTYYSYSNNYAVLKYFNIFHDSTFVVQLHRAYYVKIHITGYTGRIALKITSGKIKLIKPVIKSVILKLPEGNYTFAINYIKNVSGLPYVYAGVVTTEIAHNTTINITVSRHMLQATVYGRVYLNTQQYIAYVPIKFISATNTTNIKVAVTNSVGYYTVTLPFGNYLVYTNYVMGRYYSHLANISVYMQTMQYNIILTPSNYITGIATLNNVPENIPINVTVYNSTFTVTPVNGVYSMILPNGTYNFFGAVIKKENNMRVAYFLNQTVSIYHSLTLNLHYVRNNITGLVLTQVRPSSPGVTPGTNISYTVKVINKGNVRERISLESLTRGWKISFEQNNFYLNPQAHKIVTLNITVPVSANYGINNITLRAVYNGQVKDLRIHVNVFAYYNTTIKFEGNNATLIYNRLETPVVIYNTGNVLQHYNVTLLNAWQLQGLGWNATLYKDNTTLNTSITVAPHSSVTLILKLVPVSQYSAKVFTVYVMAVTSNYTYLASYSPILPQIIPSAINITGVNYTTTIPSFDYNTFLAMVVIVVGALIAIVLYIRVRR